MKICLREVLGKGRQVGIAEKLGSPKTPALDVLIPGVHLFISSLNLMFDSQLLTEGN